MRAAIQPERHLHRRFFSKLLMALFSPRPRRHWSDRRILILVALSALIVTIIWHLPAEAVYLSERTGELFLALTLALTLTYVMRPVVRFIERFTPKSVAVLATFALLCVALYAMFLVGFVPVQRDVSGLIRDVWPKEPAARMALIQQWQASINAALEPYRGFLPDNVRADPVFIKEQVGPLLGGAKNWLGGQKAHLGFIVELLLIPVLAFYFLAEGPQIRREARLFVPAAWRAPLSRMGEHFDFVLDGYVRGQLWMCIIAWVLVTLTLLILGVPHAVTLGLIAGFTRAIPVIGPLLGAIPLLVVCLIYTQSVQTTTLLLGAFMLMHLIESKILLPKIVGHHVDLHPVTVIIALLIGLEFFGFMGVFLAVPIAAVIKIALVEYQRNQQAKLLANGATPNGATPNGEIGNGVTANGAMGNGASNAGASNAGAVNAGAVVVNGSGVTRETLAKD